jgi:hypothetical protein
MTGILAGMKDELGYKSLGKLKKRMQWIAQGI